MVSWSAVRVGHITPAFVWLVPLHHDFSDRDVDVDVVEHRFAVSVPHGADWYYRYPLCFTIL
jgi:hypothetical protein